MALGERPSDWSDWVSASETYHYCDRTPLIDYLNLYGELAGFVADSHRPGYDKCRSMMEILAMLRRHATNSLAKAA